MSGGRMPGRERAQRRMSGDVSALTGVFGWICDDVPALMDLRGCTCPNGAALEEYNHDYD